MKTRFVLSLSIFILYFQSINAQSIGSKWESVFENSELTVLVDTSTIKQFETQISVLSLTLYKKPQLISSLNQEAASIKSQLLFNAASKKYTVIGTLYYDQNLKILGETSLPGFTAESDKFSLPVEGNEAMIKVFNRCVKYLKSGLAVIENKEFSKAGDKNKELFKNEEQRNKVYSELHKENQKDTAKAVDRVALYLSKKDSVQRAEQAKLVDVKPAEEKPQTIKEISKPAEENKNVKTSEKIYDSKNERNPRNLIFTDGSQYCFQVSAWKIKSQAEREVQILKRKGHNAFITDAVVRGSKWYRVRIGYFNSLDEAEAYMKKLK